MLPRIILASRPKSVMRIGFSFEAADPGRAQLRDAQRCTAQMPVVAHGARRPDVN
jgi:hypothetical protein